MNRRQLLALLAATAIVLIGILIFELSRGDPVQQLVSAAIDLPETAGAAADDSTSAPANWMQTALARPLFEVTRRPESSDVPSLPSIQPVDHPAELPRLTGIVISRADSQAIFQAGGSEKPVSVGVGGTISGWNIVEIAIAGVTVDGPGGRQVLQPTFDVSAPNAAPPPAFPPGTQPGAFGVPNGRANVPVLPGMTRGLVQPLNQGVGQPQGRNGNIGQPQNGGQFNGGQFNGGQFNGAQQYPGAPGTFRRAGGGPAPSAPASGIR